MASTSQILARKEVTSASRKEVYSTSRKEVTSASRKEVTSASRKKENSASRDIAREGDIPLLLRLVFFFHFFFKKPKGLRPNMIADSDNSATGCSLKIVFSQFTATNSLHVGEQLI